MWVVKIYYLFVWLFPLRQIFLFLISTTCFPKLNQSLLFSCFSILPVNLRWLAIRLSLDDEGHEISGEVGDVCDLTSELGIRVGA